MVYIKASDVIEEFYDHVYLSSESCVLAESKPDAIEVLMYDDNGYPRVIVLLGGIVTDSVYLDEPEEAENIVEEIYKCYIDGEFVAEKDDDEYNDEAEFREHSIKCREAELKEGAEDFLAAILETTRNEAMTYRNCVSEIVDTICAMVHNKYHLDVYRPMELEMDDGNVIYTEYPYEYDIS